VQLAFNQNSDGCSGSLKQAKRKNVRMSRMLDRKNAFLKIGLLTASGLGALSRRAEASTGLQSQTKAVVGRWLTRTIGVGAVLLALSAVGTGRAAPPAGQTTSNELHQVAVNMLDPAAMSTSMVSFVEQKRQEVFAHSSDAVEDEKMYPGFNDHVRRRVAQEVRSTVLQRIPHLQRQYEYLLRGHLAPDDIKALLAFQRDPVSAQLRDPAFVQSLETDDPSGADISQRMVARMTPQQRAFSARFLQSPSGRKFIALGPRLEALKDKWMQRVLDEVAQRMPTIGESILQQYQP
jgi:hypothetical protein